MEGSAMSSSVLFDSPGPATRARHRTYNLVAIAALLLLAAGLIWRLWAAGQFEYNLWEPFVTPDFMKALLVGMLKTLQLAFTSVILAVVFGLVFGVGKLSVHAWVRWPAAVVVEFFRAVPVLLLMIFVFLAYGAGGGFGSYWSVVIALTLYNGSVLAEVFRAGILAVPHGQSDAAYALGMRKSQVMNSVLLPQGVKMMLPAIISQCVVALKDTTLGYAILAPGLATVGKQIYTEFHNQIPTTLLVAAMFIAVNLALTELATWLQRRLVGEKKQLEVNVVGGPASGAAT